MLCACVSFYCKCSKLDDVYRAKDMITIATSRDNVLVIEWPLSICCVVVQSPTSRHKEFLLLIIIIVLFSFLFAAILHVVVVHVMLTKSYEDVDCCHNNLQTFRSFTYTDMAPLHLLHRITRHTDTFTVVANLAFHTTVLCKLSAGNGQ